MDVKNNFIKNAAMVIFASDLIVKNDAGHVSPEVWEKIQKLATEIYETLQAEVIQGIRSMLK